MKALKKLSAAALALSLPLAGFAQTPEPAKPAESAPAATPAPAPAPAPSAVAKVVEKVAEAKPTVALYGTLNVNFQTTRAGGATNPSQSVSSRFATSTDSSNIGVRGGLTVNEWVGATYQCETSASVDGINPSGICNRNSRLGLTGSWGTLFYGNWDTPFKAASYGTKADDPFQNTDVFGFQGIMGSPGFNYRSGGWSTASNSTNTGFDIRANNSVAYWSPKWNGISLKAQYSADEFKNASGTMNPELYGAVVNVDYGMFSVLAAYERHEDGFALVGMNAPPAAGAAVAGTFGSTAANTVGTAAAANSSTDQAWRVGAGVQLDSPAGATTVSALFEQLIYEQDNAVAGAITEFKRTAWQVALKHRYANHELRARYSMADEGDVELNGGGGSTDGYGADQLALGYAYHFTKSLQGYLSYTKIQNERNAQYTPTIGGSSAVAGNTPKGANPQALGLGLRFAF